MNGPQNEFNKKFRKKIYNIIFTRSYYCRQNNFRGRIVIKYVTCKTRLFRKGRPVLPISNRPVI